MPMRKTDDLLTDDELALTTSPIVESKIWRNPTTADGAVAHRTWRIESAPKKALQIWTPRPAHSPNGAMFWVGSQIGEWGSGEGIWPDFLPVFPAGDWRSHTAHRSGTMLTTTLAPEDLRDLPAGPFLIVLATVATKLDKADKLGRLVKSVKPRLGTPASRPTTGVRHWRGERLYCSDETVTIRGAKVTAPVPPKGPTAMIAPAPTGKRVFQWSASPRGPWQPLGKPRITHRWNDKKECFQRVAAAIIAEWPFGSVTVHVRARAR